MREPRKSLFRILKQVVNLLADYHRRNGVGVDPYWAVPIVHPMAEGKYLQAVATLIACSAQLSGTEKGCLGPIANRSCLQSILLSSSTRLRQAAGIPSANMMAWGLGFPYRGLPKDEIYTITTSIVVRGLLEIEKVANVHCPEDISDMAACALRWLSSGVPRVQVLSSAHVTVDLPCFSPRCSRLITNAAAYWLGVQAQSAKSGYSEEAIDLQGAAAWLMDEALVPRIGWPYSRDNGRVDLVHQCYVLGGLLEVLPVDRVEPHAFDVLVRFWRHGRFIDKFDLLSREEACKAAIRSSRVTIESHAAHYLTVYDAPARIWSIGELLLVLAVLRTTGERKAFWDAWIRRATGAALALPQEQVRRNVRHGMHLAHGLAAVVAAQLRG